MKLNPVKLILWIAPLLILSLSACEKTRQQFDFTKKAPDEFSVVKRAPLEMPPDYNLRPPAPGVARPQELQTNEQARQLVLGDRNVLGEKGTATTKGDIKKIQGLSKNMSEGEARLLDRTGAARANSNIRQIVDRETAQIIGDETTPLDKALKKIGREVEEPASEVDPVAETNRMKANKKAGKPVTEGKTIVKEN